MRCYQERKKRGMLIIFSLLFTIILLIMVGSVLTLTRQGKFQSSNYSGRVAAAYAAEAGVADAVEHLNDDNTWRPENYKVTLPNGHASYTIRFADTPSGDPNLSVNNLHSTAASIGPRGAQTVPPASVYLVVDGQSQGQTQRMEVVMQATPFRSLNGPFVTSGRIELSGNVTVDGVKSFSNLTRVKAGLHSNLSGTNSNVITWFNQRGERANISGEVTTSSVGSDAINMNLNGFGGFTSEGTDTGVSARKFPRIDIEKIVERANDKGIPTFTPSVGVNVVSGGDRSFSGGVINGDLVLDSGNLYVTGDLRVNGSITGSGSIYVLGKTTFSGSSDVNVVEEGHVALYSQGHVQLEGFNGSDFLGAAARNVPDQFAEPLQVTKSMLKSLQEVIEDGNVESSTFGSGGSRVDKIRSALGESVVDPNAIPSTVATSQTNSLRKLSSALESLPTDDAAEAKTVNFLRTKIDRLAALTDNKVRYLGDGHYARTTMADVELYLRKGVVREGLLDYVNDYTGNNRNVNRARKLIAAEIQSLDFNALGSSYFKGLIYTSGAVHSSNDIEIHGGIYAQRTADSPTTPLVVDGKAYSAGDTSLKNGCRVRYVRNLLENPASNRSRVLVVPVNWLVTNR